MINTRHTHICLLFFFIFTFIHSICEKIAKSDGWTQDKGHGIFIATLGMQSFNNTNSLGQYDKNNKIYQSIFNLYGEYGITNRFTIGGKIIAIDNMIMKDNKFFNKLEKSSAGLDILAFFTRMKIIRNNTIAFSLAFQIQAPSLYHTNEASCFSIRKWSYEFRPELGINLTDKDFLTFTAGYHRNINYWYDEIRFELLYGHYFTNNFLVMLRLQKYIYIIHSYKEANKIYSKRSVSINDYLSNSGFAKITLSTAIILNEKYTMEVGFYSSIKSKIFFTKKLGLGLVGCYVSIWMKK